MTQIDFYFNAPDLIQVTQKLLVKAMQAKTNVVVLGDETQLQTLDEYLWAYNPSSFMPHVWAHSPEAAHTAILLSTTGQDIPASHYTLLINLGITTPHQFTRYTRLLELIKTDETHKQAGRDRFKFYKQRGYPMSHIDLAAK